MKDTSKSNKLVQPHLYLILKHVKENQARDVADLWHSDFAGTKKTAYTKLIAQLDNSEPYLTNLIGAIKKIIIYPPEQSVHLPEYVQIYGGEGTKPYTIEFGNYMRLCRIFGLFNDADEQNRVFDQRLYAILFDSASAKNAKHFATKYWLPVFQRLSNDTMYVELIRALPPETTEDDLAKLLTTIKQMVRGAEKK